MFSEKVEVDERYFGGSRKGNRGREAAGKVPVFGLLKYRGKGYTQIIQDAKGLLTVNYQHASYRILLLREKVIYYFSTQNQFCKK